MFSRLKISWSSENTMRFCIHFLNPKSTYSKEWPISNFVQISSRKWKTYIYLYVTKKKESIDIQIKYFFPVYINALLNKLFIDNKRHHACIIPFLFLPQLCKMLFVLILSTYFCTTSTLRRFNEEQYIVYKIKTIREICIWDLYLW